MSTHVTPDPKGWAKYRSPLPPRQSEPKGPRLPTLTYLKARVGSAKTALQRLDLIADLWIEVAEDERLAEDERGEMLTYLTEQSEVDRLPDTLPRLPREEHSVELERADLLPVPRTKRWSLSVLSRHFVLDHLSSWDWGYKRAYREHYRMKRCRIQGRGPRGKRRWPRP